eukprot:CAMPEP_0195512858 /NCGR_PEP_ID=MMETSP0794_2-20130614/4671_1 /TAXON_ID=515487 /ORGANISM="Stephanopyxis turris, Strain CCMP 815" /LENGTH=66 /DNA_ID=CAMNT_0040640735 /DNA_START=59 /DNA_END=256 /DNA_ORIENTATION=+
MTGSNVGSTTGNRIARLLQWAPVLPLQFVILPKYAMYTFIAMNALSGAKMAYDPALSARGFGYEEE